MRPLHDWTCSHLSQTEQKCKSHLIYDIKYTEHDGKYYNIRFELQKMIFAWIVDKFSFRVI